MTETQRRVDGTGQPIGFPVQGWQPRPRPPREPMVGRWCRLEPLDPARHAEELFNALAEDQHENVWVGTQSADARQ